MDGADRAGVLTPQQAQEILSALSLVQQQAVGMFVQARVQFAVENALRSAQQQTRLARAPEPEPDEPPVGDGAYLDGGGDVEPAPRPASMDEYRERLRERQMSQLRSQPGGVDTRQLDREYQAPTISREEVAVIAEQVANAVLSRYAQPVPQYAQPAYPQVLHQQPPATVTSGRFPFAPYYPTGRR